MPGQISAARNASVFRLLPLRRERAVAASAMQQSSIGRCATWLLATGAAVSAGGALADAEGAAEPVSAGAAVAVAVAGGAAEAEAEAEPLAAVESALSFFFPHADSTSPPHTRSTRA